MGAAFDPGLLNAWQRSFPLVPRPFEAIGRRHGLMEAQAIEAFKDLQACGHIDRIGPVFRPNTVGASTLAAMAVPAGRLEEVAALVQRHAGVNHNYEREHRYNLWFVVTATSGAELEWTLSCIEYASRLPLLRLPLVEEYHIDLGFDLVTGAAPRGSPRPPPRPIPDEERALVPLVAPGLPLVPRPFAALGLDEAWVIRTLERWLKAGTVRRIGAIVRHRPLGYRSNAMVVWCVPDELVGRFGARLAEDPVVTLAYRRARAAPHWPYDLYCMVHGRDRDRVIYEIKRLTANLGLGAYPRAILFSRRCFAQRAALYG
jgi:siroheme decarboxylase